jgi:hypothetical protein
LATLAAAPAREGEARVARGLGIAVHAPIGAAAGRSVAVAVTVFGFPSVRETVPLPNAAITASVDPESLATSPPESPPVANATADASGDAVVDVAIPPGVRAKSNESLSILVRADYAGRTRTQAVTVKLTPVATVRLFVDHTHVGPGESVRGWVFASDTKGPRKNERVRVTLNEDGATRSSEVVTTDESGMAQAIWRVPQYRFPPASLSVGGYLESADAAGASTRLEARRGHVAEPKLRTQWTDASRRAGEVAEFTLSLRDGVGDPIENGKVRYWIGARGTEPPAADAETPGSMIAAVTDENGNVVATATTPKLFKGSASELRVLERAEDDGQT